MYVGLHGSGFFLVMYSVELTGIVLASMIMFVF